MTATNRRTYFLIFCTALIVCGGCDSSAPKSIVGDCPILGGTTAFEFTPVTNAPLNSYITSDEIRIRCGDNLGVSITGGSYSIDGGSFVNTQGRISDGQRLRVQALSASTYGTRVSAGVQVGFLGTFNVASARFDVTTVAGDPANAPTATIVSPVDNAAVNTSRINVLGQASDPDGVAEVRVNGELAITDDAFATWAVSIPLVSGQNTITVSTSDSLLNSNPVAATITIDNEAVVAISPVDIAVDEQHARVLILDNQLPGLIAVGLVSGEHVLISDNQTPNADVPFVNPARIEVNRAGDSAWILDYGYADLVAVNLVTGNRTLAADTTGGDPTSIEDGRNLVIDEISNAVHVLVGSLNSTVNDTRIVSVNLDDGSREELSSDTIPDADNPFGSSFHGVSMVFDSVGYRLLVFQEEYVLAVDPLVGTRSVLTATGVDSPVDATLDLQNNRALVLNRFSRTIYSVDLNSANVESLWYIPGMNSQRIAVDLLNNRVLIVTGPTSGEVLAVDMATGDVSIAY